MLHSRQRSAHPTRSRDLPSVVPPPRRAHRALGVLGVIAVLFGAGCGGGGGDASETQESQAPAGPTVLFEHALDDLDGVIARDGVGIDTDGAAEGTGALRIDVDAATTVPLAEVALDGTSGAWIEYEARLRTEGLQGKAFLEMWVHVPGQGESFSRGLASALGGTNGWTTLSTPMNVPEGTVVDRARLNVVVTGPGTVWVDALRLRATPLER